MPLAVSNLSYLVIFEMNFYNFIDGRKTPCCSGRDGEEGNGRNHEQVPVLYTLYRCEIRLNEQAR